MEDCLCPFPRDPFTDAAEAALLLVHTPDHFPRFLTFLQFCIIVGKFRRLLIVAAVAFHADRRGNGNAHHCQIKDRTDHIQDGRAKQDQPVGRDLPAHDRDHLKRRQIHQRPGALNGKAVYPEVKHHRQRERRHKDLDRPADPFHHALRQPVIGVQEQHDRDLEGQLDDQSEQDHQDCLHRMDPEHGKRPDPDHKPDAHGSHIVHPGALKQHQLRADRRREYKVRVGRPEENPLSGRIGHEIAQESVYAPDDQNRQQPLRRINMNCQRQAAQHGHHEDSVYNSEDQKDQGQRLPARLLQVVDKASSGQINQRFHSFSPPVTAKNSSSRSRPSASAFV